MGATAAPPKLVAAWRTAALARIDPSGSARSAVPGSASSSIASVRAGSFVLMRMELPHSRCRSSIESSRTMRPDLITPKLVAMRSSWSRTWLEITMVTPRSRLRRTRAPRMALVDSGSSPLNGSSSKSRSGPPTSASASPRRCFMPRENFLTRRLPVSARPTSSSSSRQCALGRTTPRASALHMRFSSAENVGRMPGSSMSAPTRENPSRARRCAPKSSTEPEVGRTSPAIIFIAVDLPAPFLPTNPYISPAATHMSRLSTARLLP